MLLSAQPERLYAPFAVDADGNLILVLSGDATTIKRRTSCREDGNLGAWNSNGQPVQPTSGTLAALTVTGIMIPERGRRDRRNGWRDRGVIHIKSCRCQVLLVNLANCISGGIHRMSPLFPLQL